MATGRSFAEFVKDKRYNGLYQISEYYVNENWKSMNLYTQNVHRVRYTKMVDATIELVYVRDLPEMRVAFEFGMQLEIDVKEGDCLPGKPPSRSSSVDWICYSGQ